jgi:hypothetical protein
MHWLTVHIDRSTYDGNVATFNLNGHAVDDNPISAHDAIASKL